MRLIDADAFFRDFPELDIEPYINAPTVEERPRGKWITTNTRIINYMDFTDITCSNCKICLLADYYTPNFCPHCGAQMDKEEDK